MNISIVLLILGMTLVTYLPRMLPLVTLSSTQLSPTLLRWLQMIPPAVLAALLAPELLLTKQDTAYSFFLNISNSFLLASIPTFLVGWVFRNFFITITTGMLCVALLRYFGV